MRDLVSKIVPEKVVVRTLTTSNGKELHKNSRYNIIEKKVQVVVNKKTQTDYEFELDLAD